ncbi:hypothetical protein ACFXPA_42165 [Amycolatopsis sp. NPDC059090]|uniref:AfsR/SARP family transcriptional regulator n=1 Tax=Amycolatopsis sp. NPDC059090 TaxID=3346723 RepID=UPI00366F8D9B
MEIRLFGTIEATGRTGPLALGSLVQYRALGVLALNLSNVVPTEHLGAALAAESSGPVSRRGIQNVVVQIRKGLALEGTVCVLTVGRGYVLNAAPEAIDLYRAVLLIHRARQEISSAQSARGLEAAMTMWKEPLFGCLATPQMKEMAGRKIEMLLYSEYRPSFELPAAARWP